MAHRQDASGGGDALVRNYHSAIVQRGILEEDILNQTLTDAGIHELTGTNEIRQGQRALHHNKCSHPLL